ncbi:hypothetical protein CSE_05090 [Caldisericum exile AZM16c01]|uniref:Uncharacterized protein n=1 Tax=Caldisericum exile (strain DSM 21853 / NBRC 104410 / AZM16c01) TaxID=511051 RepID=A0A7U6GE14_CALEA|nr:hypothetical protein CSE_05090 [Caldisericum exile AZM16c01]
MKGEDASQYLGMTIIEGRCALQIPLNFKIPFDFLFVIPKALA